MVISLAGEWDIYRRQELEERLRPAKSEPNVVLDLTSAKYITSTLICALILTHKERERLQLAPMSLAVQSAFVRRLLAATGLHSIFPLYDSVEEALVYKPPTPRGEPSPVARSYPAGGIS